MRCGERRETHQEQTSYQSNPKTQARFAHQRRIPTPQQNSGERTRTLSEAKDETYINNNYAKATKWEYLKDPYVNVIGIDSLLIGYLSIMEVYLFSTAHSIETKNWIFLFE